MEVLFAKLRRNRVSQEGKYLEKMSCVGDEKSASTILARASIMCKWQIYLLWLKVFFQFLGCCSEGNIIGDFIVLTPSADALCNTIDEYIRFYLIYFPVVIGIK